VLIVGQDCRQPLEARHRSTLTYASATLRQSSTLAQVVKSKSWFSRGWEALQLSIMGSTIPAWPGGEFVEETVRS